MKRNLKVMIVLIMVLVLVTIGFVYKIVNSHLSNSVPITYNYNGKSIEIVSINKKSTDGRYVIVGGKANNELKYYIFDTKKETLQNLTDANRILVSGQIYSATQKENGKIEVHDLLNNKLIYHIDLGKEWTKDGVSVAIRWSSTQKYLFLKINSLRLTKLIDIQNKIEVPLPVEGMVSIITWSPDDRKAILEKPIKIDNKKGGFNTYLWDFESDNVRQIGREISSSLKWTPDSKNIYYLSSKPDEYNINIFNISKGEWKTLELINTVNIDERYIKWVSENEVILPATYRNRSLLPWASYFNRFKFYAVKVNLDNGKRIKKNIGGYLAREYMWSYDNKYIYYIDDQGFYKVKINF